MAGPRVAGSAAPFACDQRYCVECGARRGSLPPAIAELIGVVPQEGLGEDHAADDELAALQAATSRATDSLQAGGLDSRSMPTPPVVAVAVMGLLAFGVLLGSAVSPTEPSGAAALLLLAVAPSTTAASPPVAAPSSTPPPSPSPSPTPPAATPAQPVASAPAGGSAPKVTAKTLKPTGPSHGSAPTAPGLPPVKHVFLIVLSGVTSARRLLPAHRTPTCRRRCAVRANCWRTITR